MIMSAAEPLPSSIAQLRAITAPSTEYRVMRFGVAALDGRLALGGLRAGALHEVAARSCSLMDDAAASLFVAGLAARQVGEVSGPVLWTSCRSDPTRPAWRRPDCGPRT
jgi:protein ImuA